MTHRYIDFIVITRAPHHLLCEHRLVARTPADAIATALEFSEPGSIVVRCTREEEW